MPTRKKASGNWNPDWEAFARLDPVWTEKLVSMSTTIAAPGAIDPKTMELVGIALDASFGYAPGVRRHIRRALDAGAKRTEIVAVLQLVSIQGLRGMCLAAPILAEELAARKTSKEKK
jgi:alkylhydroperoxidase/carboxymuconolactone decarboxylase family protein YurZ